MSVGPDLVKIEIIKPSLELESARIFVDKEVNIEMTEKLRVAGVYPFWYSSHPETKAGISYIRFVAYGVPDEKEAISLQWDNRAARIRIGFKP